MTAVTAGASPTAGRDRRGPVPARTAGAAAADRSPASARPARTVRSWPLLVLAAPAAAEVWSGWAGIAQKTGFGLVSPLPGIWPALHLDTSITLPVGVEAYAAYALRVWLSGEPWIGDRTRRFAKWSAICSFALGMAGQVAYHLLAQAGAARAPWPITMIVSCLPVLVLAMGTALAHMLRADAAPDAPDSDATGRAGHGVVPGPVRRGPERTRPRPARGPRIWSTGHHHTTGAAGIPRSRADHSTGAAGCPDADGPGAPHRPQARRSREASIPASAARRRRQRLQRITQRPGPQAQHPTSKPEDKPPVDGEGRAAWPTLPGLCNPFRTHAWISSPRHCARLESGTPARPPDSCGSWASVSSSPSTRCPACPGPPR